MKKSLTIALVLAALTIFTGLAAAQQQPDTQKNPPTGQTGAPPKQPVSRTATTVRGSKSNSSEYLVAADSPRQLKGTVTEVNDVAKTFTAAVTFSYPPMKSDISRITFDPRPGSTIDVTYTQTPSGAMEVTTIKTSKSNSSDRLVGGDYGREYRVPGQVTEVNNGDLSRQTFKVGNTIDAKSPGEAMAATTIKGSKSNSSERVAAPDVTLGETMAATTVSSSKSNSSERAASPDITYAGAPSGGGIYATTIKASKSNSSERVGIVEMDNSAARQLQGKVIQVNPRAMTFTVAVVFSIAQLLKPRAQEGSTQISGDEIEASKRALQRAKLLTVGQIIDITYTPSPGGGPLEASNLNLSKSNIN